MESVQQQLERLMTVCADAELRFDDGVLPANSGMLSVFSSVLRDAVEVHTTSAEGNLPPSSSITSKTIVLPMQGLTKAQWLQAAPFWYPVEPAPVVQTWQEVELLLRIGSRFDLRPVLQKAGAFLAANVGQLTAASSSSSTSTSSNQDLCIWTWLLLADELRLSSSLPALINRAVEIDLAGCSVLYNTQGLSAATLQRLLAAATAEVLSLKATATMYCTSPAAGSATDWDIQLQQVPASGSTQLAFYQNQQWRCPHCGTVRQ